MLSVRLRHRFAQFTLDAAFEAPAGVTALFGRSGAGKTTLVNAAAGLFSPDEGRIAVGGRVLFDRAAGIDLPAHRRRIGYVFQDHRLFPHLTVAQNLTYGARFAPSGAQRPEADAVISMLGIAPLLTRRPGALSGGERGRVAIGRALMAAPELLILDEPLAALDAERRAEILPYLERLRDSTQVPMLYISHAVPEIVRLATTLVVIEAGHVIGAGPLVDLLADPASVGWLDPAEVGAVLPGRVRTVDPDGLAQVDLSDGQTLLIPAAAHRAGDRLRLRVRAQDVVLFSTPPVGSSALNLLSLRVTAITLGADRALIALESAGGLRLLAQITQRSVTALGLSPGAALHASVKAGALG